MGPLEVVAGVFVAFPDALAASAAMKDAPGLESARAEVRRVGIPGEGAERIALVAWVPPRSTRQARELIWSHHGRQAPIAWLDPDQGLLRREGSPFSVESL